MVIEELELEAEEKKHLSPGRPKKHGEMFPHVFDNDDELELDPGPIPSTTHTASSMSVSKAKATAKAEPKDSERAARSRDKATQLLGTNARYVQNSKFLNDHHPDLLKQVQAGTLTMPQAKKQVKAEQKAAARAAEVAAMQLEVKGNYALDLIHGDALEYLFRQ